jgi:DNA-binding response OmpR family regulator
MDVKKILIVEDDAEIATMYKLKFEREEFEVHVCDNWLNAVTDIISIVPDVVLLDLMMPTMDGFETLRVIRQLAPSLKTKIVMFTNLNNQADIDRCMELWADDFLLKASTTPKEAVERIRVLLDETQLKKYIPDENNEVHLHCPECHSKFSIHIQDKK